MHTRFEKEVKWGWNCRSCYHSEMHLHSSSTPLLLVLTILIVACNPAYNWRDHMNEDGAFRVQFPSKPSAHTQPIELGGLKVDMTMTATEVEDVTYAVGTAVLPNASIAQEILPAMRLALLRNIGATSAVPEGQPEGAVLDVDATGRGNGGPVRIVGKFMAKGARVYQVIVVGRPGAMPAAHTEQFLDSFAPQ